MNMSSHLPSLPRRPHRRRKEPWSTPIIIAQKETNRLLSRDDDPNRPLATVRFANRYRLAVGNQVLELSYRRTVHAPDRIFIHAPRQRTLMIVDVVFPGCMPWRRFAVAQDVPEYFTQVRHIGNWDFNTLVGGHVARTGTRADVATQLAFMEDLKAAAEAALKRTTLGEGLNPSDRENPWAVFDHYINRVVGYPVLHVNGAKWVDVQEVEVRQQP
jgi:hypothetical protein